MSVQRWSLILNDMGEEIFLKRDDGEWLLFADHERAVAGWNAGYAAALRDAVEAVETQWTDDPMWDGTNWNNALFCAKEAIEALGNVTDAVTLDDSEVDTPPRQANHLINPKGYDPVTTDIRP